MGSYLAGSLSAGSLFEIVLFHFFLAGSLSAGSLFLRALLALHMDVRRAGLRSRFFLSTVLLLEYYFACVVGAFAVYSLGGVLLWGSVLA